jgi:heat shock protein HtpX
LIHFIIFVPLVAAGGLVGLLHEGIRRKRLAARLFSNTTRGAPDVETPVADMQVVGSDDLVQIRHSERAAHIALGVSTAGALFYPPLGIASLPIIGYSALNWLRARYPSERLWLESPSRILAILALGGSLATGHWVLASLVLTVDLAARKWASQRAGPGATQARPALSRRGNSLRVALFLLTNVAVLLLMSVVLAVLGVAPANLLALAALALGFGMSGSFISLALSKWIAKLTTGARVIDEPGTDAEQWLIDTVARHAARAGIGMPEVAIFDSQDMNAFATGMKRDRALVAVSTGMIARMTPAEVEAVLGHELAHVANGDMVTLALIQGVLDTFVIFISRVVAGVIDGFTRSGRDGGGLGSIGYWVVVMVLQLTLGLLAMLIVMWFSRQREFRADAGGAELAGREEMIAALERLRTESQQSQLPDRLAALGIHSSPSRLAKLFSSHPPLEERITALRASSPRPVSDSPPSNDIEAMR